MTAAIRTVLRAPAHRARRARGAGPGRARDRRRTAALTVVLALLVAGAVTVTPLPAQAAITTPFEVRFRANTNGDIALRGNTLMTCPAGPACTDAENRSGTTLNNNDFAMRFVDVDSDPATRSSSSAQVSLPAAGSVLFAGLYWSAYTSGPTAPPSGTAPGRLLLRPPGASTYTTVTASRVATSVGGSSTSYQAFADVTSVVAGARSGTYTAADIHAARGADRYGAWTLVVAYTDPTLPARNLTVFDGYGVVQNSPAGDRTLSIPVSGFATPPAGPFTTRLGAVTYEGDAGLTGDSFSITDSAGVTSSLSNPLNPTTNAFNSTVSDAGTFVPGRTPAQTNTFGYDADVFSGQLVSPGSTSATLRLQTGGETFFPGVVTFATELFAPTLVAEKSQTPQDVDGDGSIGPGDRIDYAVTVRNTGRDAAVQTTLADPLPVGTRLVPGSIRVDGATVTEAADADRGELVGDSVSVRLGTNPGTVGGRLPVGTSTTVSFSVDVVGAELSDGALVVNRAAVRYRGEQVGQSLSGTSNVVTQVFTAPRSDLRVTKAADPAVLQADGDRTLTWTATVVNDGPAPDAGVTFSDELPAGFTATSVDGPGCVLTGSTVGCDVGALAVGQSATVVVTGTVDAGVVGSLTNTATAAGESVDPTPASGTAVVAVNRPPVATDDTATVPGGAGSQVSIPVLDNDSDPDGDPLTVPSVSVTPPAHGTVQVLPDGTLVYTVTDPTFAGTETITYQVCDDRGGCDTATVTVVVANQPPAATDDTTGTDPGTPVTVDVLADDTDPNGDPLTVTAVSQPTSGAATIVGDQVVVTPDPGFEGELVVEYTVCDDATPPLCDTATLTVLVDNAAPVARDDTATTPFQTPLTLQPADLLADDTDPNPGDVLTVTGVADGTGGTVVRDPDTGAITFTPAPGFTGTASFTYTITDGEDTSTATVYVEVPNTAPVALDDVADAPGGGDPVAIDLLSNDTDAESPDDLTVTVIGLPTDGTVLVDEDGTATYVPDPGFKGTDTFDYQVCDPQGLCDTATVTVTVSNQPPAAGDDERTVRPGETVQVPVLLDDTDPNGDPLTLTRIVTPPGQGTATVDPGTGLLTYTPAPGQTGPVTITYEVCDDDPVPACDTATVTVGVVNSPPEAQRDAAFAFHTAGRPTVVPVDVLANDADPDGEALTVTGVSQPLTGSAAVVDGQIVYTAPAGFVGQVTFSYEVADGTGGTSQSTVLVTIGNVAPTALDDAVRLEAGRSAPVDVLANDSDPDGDPLTIRLGTPSGGGTAQVVDGQVLFTSDGTLGTFTVPYEACDPYGACEPAVLVVEVVQRPTSDLRVTKTADPAVLQAGGDRSVEFTVAVVNDGPAPDPEVVLTDDLPAGFTATSVDGPGCAVTAGTVTCELGALAVGATAVVTITGTVDPGITGTVANTATAQGDSVDPTPASGTAVVAVNRPPVATDDTATVAGGAGSQVSIPVLDNDSDPDGDPLTVPSVSVTPPAHGTVQVLPDGTLVYTVTDPAFAGTETITYQVCDDRGGCDTATVTVEVGNQAPVATDDTTGTSPDTAVAVDVVANDTDPNGDPLTVTAVTQPDGGTATIVGDQVVLTPDPGFEGELVVGYTVCDDGTPQLCDTATLTVLVDEAAPVARDDTLTTPFQTPLTIEPSTLLVNDSDPNPGDVLTITSVADGTGGTVVRDPDTGAITFTPAPGFTGTASFTYTITDGDLTSTATVYVEVPNTAPVALDDVATVAGGGGQVAIEVLANDTDAETPDDLTVTVVGAPTNGSVVVDGGGEIVYYAADPAFKGTDTFDYQVCDPQGLCDTATVTVTVQNQPPAAQDDERTVLAGGSVEVPVLLDDTDPNGDALVLTRVVDPPAHGTVSVDPDTGLLTYAPAPGRFDPVTITYEVCDDDPVPACDTAVVTITVVGGPPVAVDDAVQVVAGDAVTVDVLANDSDPDGDPLTVVLGTPSGGGTAAVVDGRVVFTSDGTPGTFTVPYQACDPSGACAAAVLTVVVLPEGAVLPEFVDRPQNERQVVVVGERLRRVVAQSPDGSPLTYEVVGGSLPDGITLRPDGTFAGRTTTVGTTAVTIEACTGDGRCVQTTLTVVVLPRAVPGDPATPGGPGDRLPRTGAEVTPLVGLATLLVLTGALALRVRRRLERPGSD